MNPVLTTLFLTMGASANSGWYSSGDNYGSNGNYKGSIGSYGGSYGGQGYTPITNFKRDILFSGAQTVTSDNTAYTTGNGISQSHNVRVVPHPGTYTDEYGRTSQTSHSIVMNGHSAYKSPEGMNVVLTWNADSNGFHPSGDHLPRSVPLPEDHAEAHRQAHAVTAAGYGHSYGGQVYAGY